MSQVLGRAYIKYNGTVLRTNNGAKLNTGGVERKTVKGVEVHGYAEEATEPFIECEISVKSDTNLSEINSITGATITFEADTGQTWVLRDAWIEKPCEVTAQEGGKVPLRFVGISCEQM